jgi:hypothetical protein
VAPEPVAAARQPAAVPLPDEPDSVTRRITADYRAAIENALTLLNEKTRTGLRLQGLTLPELFQQS